MVCFDEVSGISFDQKDGVNIMKGYMESGEFSRGKESIRCSGSIVMLGNFDVDVPDAGFSSEITRLTGAFEDMATRLADTETTRRQLLSDLAHELRTPLATLEAYVDGIEDEVLPVEAATFATMRDLARNGRNHIWGYYVRNLIRPIWLTMPEVFQLSCTVWRV